MKRILIIVTIFTLSIVHGQVDTTKVIEMNGVSVTGVRSNSKMPITETTITKDDIKRNYQGEEVSSVLDRTPSIISHSDGGHPQGYTYFRLRGIDQTRINMTLNGVPLNEPEDQGGYFSNYSGFANNIKSLQIQRGVGTSSNGVSSYGGSINFESPVGLDKGSEIELGYGSYNTMRFNASNSTGLIDKGFSLYSNFSSYKTDGYKYNSGGSGYSFFLSGAYHGVKDIIKLTAFSGQSFNQMAWLAVSKDDINEDQRTNYNSELEKDDFMQSSVQLQHTRKLTSNSLLNTTVYYNRLDGGWSGLGDTLTDFRLSSNFLGFMTNYKYIKNGLVLNIGGHGNLYERSHTETILPYHDSTLFKNRGYKNEVSGFTKATYDIGDVTLFTDLQVRYVMFKYVGDVDFPTQDWAFFNPKIGLTYRLSKTFKSYISVGQSYREPTRGDMFMGESNLDQYVINNPEEVIDFELGASYISSKFSAKVNVYYMDFKNEIIPIGEIGGNTLPLMQSVPSSFRSGIEIELTYKPIKSLTISNNTNLSYNRIEFGDYSVQPLYTPPVVSNTNITYTYKGWYLGLDIKAHSSSYIGFNSGETIESFTILGMGVGYTYREYTISGKINNITNERYYTSGYMGGNTPYYYVNAPTNVYLTLKIKL